MAHSPATGQRAGGPVAPLSIRGLLELQDELDPDDAAQHVSGDRHGGEGQANKKRKLAKTADFTRRKRAATACQFCRLRKTKCDNVRPCCGYCERQKAKCIYGESEWLEDTVEDPDQSEGMGRRILKHLEEIKEMLATNQSRLPTNPSVNTPTVATAATPRTTLQTTTTPRTIGQSPWTDATDNGSQTTSTKAPASNAVSRPHALARCESLLRWPIFNGIVSEEVARIESFLTDSDYKARQQDANAPTRHASQEQTGKGIRDDAFVPLCRKFLTHVHPRNPVLDADELMRFARDAEEHGVKWDSESCLVVSQPALRKTRTNMTSSLLVHWLHTRILGSRLLILRMTPRPRKHIYRTKRTAGWRLMFTIWLPKSDLGFWDIPSRISNAYSSLPCMTSIVFSHCRPGSICEKHQSGSMRICWANDNS